MDNFLEGLLGWLPLILMSLTVHEFAHAYTAYRFGDNTARNAGRMTLNPIVHIDLTGLVVMVLSNFRIGWAKPVPVNLSNFKNPAVADIVISVAGPASNVMLAVVAATLFRITPSESIVNTISYNATLLNIALAMFNMFPIYPLDGSHILMRFLPTSLAMMYRKSGFIVTILFFMVLYTTDLLSYFWITVTNIANFLVGY